MFIYKFMSGVVDTVRGDDNEEFDPHTKRKVDNPTTYSETMIHLLKGCIGAGILAMPEACMRVGIVYGSIGIIVIGAFACYCLQLLILAQYEICKKWKRGYLAYPKSMLLAVRDGPKCLRWSGRLFYTTVDVMLVLWQIGVCAIYLVFVAVSLDQVLQHYGVTVPVRLLILCLFPVQLAANIVKDLKLLTPISSFSNFVTIFGMLLVFFYLIEDDVIVDDEKFEVKSLQGIPLFVGTTLFALEAVGVVLALEYNMEHPSQFTGALGLLSVGMAIIVILFLMMGTAGYMKYGEDIKASITLNLPPEEKKAQLAKLSFATALFFSFPLQNFVAYQILWRIIKKKTTPTRSKDYLLRVVLVVVPFIMAIAAPNLGAFISLLGALCLSLVAIVFPAIMDLCIWYPDKYGYLQYKLLRDLAIIVLGMLCLCSGVYSSMLEFAATDATSAPAAAAVVTTSTGASAAATTTTAGKLAAAARV